MTGTTCEANIFVLSVLVVGSESCGGRVEARTEDGSTPPAPADTPDSSAFPPSDASSADTGLHGDATSPPSDAGLEAETGEQDAASDAASSDAGVTPLDPLERWLLIWGWPGGMVVRAGPNGFGQPIDLPFTDIAGFGWSPDGRYIGTCDGNDAKVLMMDEVGIAETITVTDDCWITYWSPTDPILVVEHETDGLWTVVDLRGPVPTSSSLLLPEESCRSPNWAPDGSAFVIETKPTYEGDPQNGWLVRPRSFPPEAHPLFNPTAPVEFECDEPCAWSSDSRWVACSGKDSDGATLPYVIDASEPSPQARPAIAPLPLPANLPTYGITWAGENWLLFTQPQGNGGMHFAARIEDGPPSQAIPIGTNDGVSVGLKYINPNPDRPFVAGSGICGVPPEVYLCLVRLSSSGASTPVPLVEGNSDGHWSPDSMWLSVLAPDQLWLLGIDDDGQLSSSTVVGSNPSHEVPVWSPDGSQLAWWTPAPPTEWSRRFHVSRDGRDAAATVRPFHHRHGSFVVPGQRLHHRGDRGSGDIRRYISREVLRWRDRVASREFVYRGDEQVPLAASTASVATKGRLFPPQPSSNHAPSSPRLGRHQTVLSRE